MITLEEVTAMGINAPIEHQRIISKLTTALGHLYYTQQTISLEPLPETMLDQDKTSPVPDILLYETSAMKSPSSLKSPVPVWPNRTSEKFPA